jgi:outer membrane protein assembly factor BamD (BamD/ComL family)
MQLKKAFLYHSFIFLLLTVFCVGAQAQPGSFVELSKPEKYENRKLGSEKTTEKKFNTSRHIYQNMVTHYNYFFNANNKLNGVLEKARLAFINDYSQLLPFYNYSLDVTAQERSELDSVIYKCTAGVLLHNLNNDWIDDMYMLLGRAYFLRKDFDSATNVFRYINYAFAPKDDGYDIPIGSNASNSNGEFTVSTIEKRNLWKKLTTHLPERNNAFLWLARTYIETNHINEAAGLLEVLKADPNFPKRLHPSLHEVMGYWFYTQQVYDSAAVQLDYTLNNTDTKQERARREYLIAQLYALSGDEEKAAAYFLQSAGHTIDPVLEAYATLNSIKLRTNKNDDAFLQQKLNKLLQLARREKYALYRDVVYYAAAQVALDLHRPEDAKKYLLKSVAGSTNNQAQRNASFLLLGDVNYDTKDYVAAHNFYDSIDNNQVAKAADKERVLERKPSLTTIAGNVTTIHYQDSLQQVASLPAAEREALVRKIVRKLRKQQGLKEDDNNTAFVNAAVQNVAPATLFNETNSSSGDWYFNNVSLKASGLSNFNTRWGKRPNVDNWRRSAAIDPVTRNQAQVAEEKSLAKKDSAAAIADTLSYDALMNRLPLNPNSIAASDEKIMQALFSNAKTFQSDLQDYPSAVETYKELLRRFPETSLQEEVLFNLNYCYRRLGDTQRQDSVKTVLQRSFPNSKWTQLANRNGTNTPVKADAATQQYEHIYNLFLEGNFEQAKKEKQTADSIYGKNHWSPQLLYIEAVYYIRQREDSIAIQRLTDLKQLDASSSLAEKAGAMIDVLKRRKEIESYLTNLQVTRADEDTPLLTDASALSTIPNASLLARRDTLATAVADPRIIRIKEDTIPVVTVNKFTFKAEEEHFVVIFLKKVDGVYVNEARNAFSRYNRENFYAEKIDITISKLDDSTQLVLMGPFPKAVLAVNYIDRTKPATRTRILPWLIPEKYEYGIISQANLDVLKEEKDLAAYKELLKQALPGKF